MTNAANQFGYDLIRNDVLHDILGSDHETILYWLGKSLARRYPLETSEQLIEFFSEASWGTLTLTKEKKKKRVFELTGPWMGKDDQRCYQLEAGFLAQQIEIALNVISATTYEQKKQSVTFIVEFEHRD